jgi:hypothetical protein
MERLVKMPHKPHVKKELTGSKQKKGTALTVKRKRPPTKQG